MRRILVLLAVLALAVSAGAEVRYLVVAATSTAQTKGVNAQHLLVINDDTTNEIYVRVFHSGESPAAATAASSIQIKAGEGVEFVNVGSISVVCDTAETASVRLIFD